MYEQSKLSESDYFYSQMLAVMSHYEIFSFNLSAFLSSARSVLQYALKEAQTKPGGQQWYDQQVNSSIILGFFKDKRDINIHSEPINTSPDVTVEITSTLHLSASLSIKHYGSDGKLISEYHETPKEESPRPDPPAKISYKYTFPDWQGDEDIPTLCRMYLEALKLFVQNGQSMGIITR